MKIYSIILFSLLLVQSSFGAAPTSINSETLLSLEKVQLQYQRLVSQYDFLAGIEELNDIENDEDLLIQYIEEVENQIMNHPTVRKENAWGKIKHLFSELKTEARILSREMGLGVTIAILTIEITEIPMKAIALSIGSPVIVVLYEVLQPGILVPAIIVGIKKLNKTIKTKKLFESKSLFQTWRDLEKTNAKQLMMKKSKAMIGLYDDGHAYLIKPKSFLVSSLRLIGLYKKRIDFHSLKRFCKRNNLAMDEMTKVKSSHYHNQLKSKILLSILITDYPESVELLERRFSKSIIALEKNSLPNDYSQWVLELLGSTNANETKSLLLNFPRSVPPLLFLELWDSIVKEEFFRHSHSLGRKEYRALEKTLLPVLIEQRKFALEQKSLKSWDSESIESIRSYLVPTNIEQ